MSSEQCFLHRVQLSEVLSFVRKRCKALAPLTVLARATNGTGQGRMCSHMCVYRLARTSVTLLLPRGKAEFLFTLCLCGSAGGILKSELLQSLQTSACSFAAAKDHMLSNGPLVHGCQKAPNAKSRNAWHSARGLSLADFVQTSARTIRQSPDAAP